MDQRIFDDMNNSDNIVEKTTMLRRSVFQCIATLGDKRYEFLTNSY